MSPVWLIKCSSHESGNKGLEVVAKREQNNARKHIANSNLLHKRFSTTKATSHSPYCSDLGSLTCNPSLLYLLAATAE